jgi:CubicO group peptidase (beta-lactamase class C family)
MRQLTLIKKGLVEWHEVPEPRLTAKRTAQVINAGLMDSSYKIPGGGYVSTPGDLVTLANVLLAGELVKPGTLKLMWTSQKLRDGKNTGYGMGWGLGQFEGEDIAAHAGGQQGASSSLTIYPKRKMVGCGHDQHG